VLVADAHGLSAHMERLMQRMGRDAGPAKRVLELNPDNPAVEAVRDLHSRNPSDPRVETYARLLYDQAVIAEGSKVADPSALSKRLSDLIARDAKS
jgi:molecular chaperone HtpG